MSENEKAHEQEFKLIIDTHPHTWHKSTITGAEIKNLAGVDPSYGVWQEVPGPNDPPVGDNQQVDLSRPGVERFFTGKKTTTEG
jgi:Multiubiquitin